MKHKRRKVILCTAALIISCLSTAISWGFLHSVSEVFWVRFLCGFCFNATPLLVLYMTIEMFRKDS